jgi:predicted adenylyl cyclase CyaB
MRNLEIKAALASLGAVRSRLRRLEGATLLASLRQTDWYFRVPHGRLKLRQVAANRDGELIAYFRPDKTAARTSEFQRMPTPDAAGTRRLLERMFGLRGCVRKRREVWLYMNARIHLDMVDGIGRFIEIEVVVTDGMRQARRLMRELMDALRISRESLIAGSYGSLLGERRLAKREARSRPARAEAHDGFPRSRE